MNTRKSKQEIKKKLEESIINDDKHENKDIKQKAVKVRKCEDEAAAIREIEDIILSKNKNKIWIAYQQVKFFEKFKEKEKFVNMIKYFGVSKLTIVFKVGVVKVKDKY